MHNAVCRWYLIELYTWNSNKFKKKKEKAVETGGAQHRGRKPRLIYLHWDNSRRIRKLERFINSLWHHKRQQSDNRKGKLDLMLEKKGRKSLIKFLWRIFLHLELMTKKMEQMDERRLGGIQISPYLPTSGLHLTSSKQNSSKYNISLYDTTRFKRIVSNHDPFC